MPDSQRESGAYPKRRPSKPGPSYSPGRNAHPAPIRPHSRSPYPSDIAQPDQAPRGHAPFSHDREAPERPRLPYAQETSQAQHERTERLRTMRKDFIDHAQTKMAPQKPRNIFLAVILTTVMLGLCIVAVVVFFQFRSTLFSPGGQDVATQFMNDMESQNYNDAYANCASAVQEVSGNGTRQLQGQSDFLEQAQDADMNGKITAYTQTGSNTLDSNTVQYTFSVTRSSTKPASQTTAIVNLIVTKQGDGSWKISSIDGALLPPAPAPPTQSTPGANGNAETIPTLYSLNRRSSTIQTQTAWSYLR